MGLFVALALLVSASSGAPVALAHGATKASASALASVRIMPGAKVSLSEEAEAQGHTLNKAVITAEDGSRRPAKLVEFQ